jgi:hypothetical protein
MEILGISPTENWIPYHNGNHSIMNTIPYHNGNHTIMDITKSGMFDGFWLCAFKSFNGFI